VVGTLMPVPAEIIRHEERIVLLRQLDDHRNQANKRQILLKFLVVFHDLLEQKVVKQSER